MRRALIAVAALLGASVPAWTGVADASPPTASFIVVLRPGVQDVPAAAAQLAASARGEVGFVYETALQGFSMTASEAAATALARNPRVAYVERDQVVTVAAQTEPTGIDRIFATSNTAIDIDASDDWRVDVDVAVIDTGVDFEHPDLNVVGGVNCATGSRFSGSCKAGGDDDHYHGTHVAGTVAAIDNGVGVVGVAPGARIHAVKVLDSRGSGYTSWIVAGIDWVAANAGTIEVANMSLGGSGISTAQRDAIQGAIDNGVAFAVAAGNSDADANNYSPAAFDNVLSVSALADFNGLVGGGAAATCRADVDDTLADFSNWGSAVDIAAPGVCITSTYPIERGEYGTISGTSMASPHVAGALALLASKGKPTNEAGVRALYKQVVDAGNLNWVDDSGDGIQERLLDVSNTDLFKPKTVPGSGSGPVPNANPTIAITSPADGASFPSGTGISLAADEVDTDGDAVTVTWTVGATVISTDNPGTWTPTDGSYTITATATDGKGGSSTDSVSIKVGGTTQTQTLTPSSTNSGKTWTAIVTSTATFSGTWEGRPTVTADCSTSSGTTTCQVTLSDISKKVPSVTFTPTSPTGLGTVTVFKP